MKKLVFVFALALVSQLGFSQEEFKADVLKKLGGYDETLAYEDLDIWIRITRNYNIEYIDTPLAEKRELSTSLSAQFLKRKNSKTKFLHESTLKIFDKILVLNQTKKENRAVLNRMYFELHKFKSAREWKLAFKLLIMMIKTYFKTL